MRKSYPTNLTDGEWHYLKSHLPTTEIAAELHYGARGFYIEKHIERLVKERSN